MRVGVVILPQFRWPEARARWVSLEQRGFAHGWTYDHLAWRDLADEPWYATIPILVAAATATSTLRLGTWVASPNFRHLVTTAKDLLTLHEISEGRLIAAVGAGGPGWDAQVLGQEPLGARELVARLDEFVTLTNLLLRQPDTTWAGRYYQARNAKMVPAGSRERITLVVAAAGPRTIRIAARADGWATTGPTTAGDDLDRWWSGLADLVRRFEDTAVEHGRDPAVMPPGRVAGRATQAHRATHRGPQGHPTDRRTGRHLVGQDPRAPRGLDRGHLRERGSADPVV
jgi:alkanesulfonate monooxygenase SsuD/methylene tetrahydromethanopterin reductase-like flavin-dependent oxidoreductase (luciferase family)